MTSIKLQLLGLASMFVICIACCTAASAEPAASAPESVAVTGETTAAPPVSEAKASPTPETTPEASPAPATTPQAAATPESTPTTESKPAAEVSATAPTPEAVDTLKTETPTAVNPVGAEPAAPATQPAKVEETKAHTAAKTAGLASKKKDLKAKKTGSQTKPTATKNSGTESELDEDDLRAMQYIQSQSNKPLNSVVTQPMDRGKPGEAAAATLTNGNASDVDTSFVKPSGSGLDSSFLKPSFGFSKTSAKPVAKSSKKPTAPKK